MQGLPFAHELRTLRDRAGDQAAANRSARGFHGLHKRRSTREQRRERAAKLRELKFGNRISDERHAHADALRRQASLIGLRPCKYGDHQEHRRGNRG